MRENMNRLIFNVISVNRARSASSYAITYDNKMAHDFNQYWPCNYNPEKFVFARDT